MFTNNSNDPLIKLLINDLQSIFTSKFERAKTNCGSDIDFLNSFIFFGVENSQLSLVEFEDKANGLMSKFLKSINFKVINIELTNISLSTEKNIEYFFDINIPFAEEIYETPNIMYIEGKYSYANGFLISQDAVNKLEVYEEEYKRMFLNKIIQEKATT